MSALGPAAGQSARAGALLAASLVLLSAQPGASTPMDDASMTDALAAFAERGPQGAALRLDAATDFAWDRVHGFPGGATIEEMRRELGAGFKLDGAVKGRLTPHSALLVFLLGGEVAREAVVGPPLFLVGLTGRGYGPDEAILMVHTRDPGPYTALRFAD
ncbi:MAG TPA: hypothetical protein VM899_08095 [Rubellimicrobium sp.]|nr:hypothetical protein [Rubellimicrobium sp.]